MGNVSAACRLDDNKCTVVSLEIEREDWRIGGSIRDSWRSRGASSSLNGRVSSTLCVSDFYATAAFSLSCLHIRGSRARVDRTRTSNTPVSVRREDCSIRNSSRNSCKLGSNTARADSNVLRSKGIGLLKFFPRSRV